MKKRFKTYYPFINRFHILFFLNGALLALTLYFYSEDSYERKLFAALANNVKQHSTAFANTFPYLKDSGILITSLHTVHAAVKSSRDVFDGNSITGFKADFISPLTVDLMTGKDACGSYSMVMARVLKELGTEVRMVQMKVDGEYGGHIILEAKGKEGWVVFDPLYDLYFKRPDGGLASFKDVQQNWGYYQLQVPADYDHKYRYEGYRYTNWNKIPVVMPVAKKILDWTVGKEKADGFSLRILALRKFRLFFIGTLTVYLLLLSYTLITLAKRKVSVRTNTVDNGEKFLAPRASQAVALKS